jgi:hypothetical protein
VYQKLSKNYLYRSTNHRSFEQSEIRIKDNYQQLLLQSRVCHSFDTPSLDSICIYNVGKCISEVFGIVFYVCTTIMPFVVWKALRVITYVTIQ